jgi:hypothetical protein
MSGMTGAPPDSSTFYVYYRVPPGSAGARAIIDALMADVAARTGIVGRLLARCDDPTTWMEIYDAVVDAGAFARTLDECVRNRGAAEVAVGRQRSVERFRAVDGNRAPRVTTEP